MKLARVLAVATAILMLVTGCSRRDDNNGSSNGLLNDAASSIEQGAEDLRSDVEDGMSRLEEDLGMSRDESMEDDSMEEPISETEDDSHIEESLSEEDSVAAMSTDFSEIGALDATSDNGFPGGPVDAQNRPSGPIGYQQKYGKYDAHFIVPDSQKIYLTFDEGYENGYTGEILDTLKEKGVKAVFFVTYPYATSQPELVKRMIDEGHVVGNHSTAHKNFPTMTLQDAADDILNLHNYIKNNFGYEMYLFRPPEGSFSEQTLALTQQLGYKSMLWSFAYKDWDVNNQPITLEATNTIVEKAHPGEICLLHAVSKTNAEILGDVIDQLRAKGFQFADYFYLTPSKQEDKSKSMKEPSSSAEE